MPEGLALPSIDSIFIQELMHMKSKSVALSVAALGLATAALPSLAQSGSSAGTNSWNMPYQSGFWGHAGISLGRTKLHADCPSSGKCDRFENAWRAYVGGKFNDILGAEVGFVDLGRDFDRGGGTTRAHGLDLSLLAGVPIGERASIFAKVGAAYLRTSVSGTGVDTGNKNDWGPRFGIGAQFNLNRNWALRVDADRYKVDFPGDNHNVDMYSVGAQYSFR
jgi:opacity protein-like surface antigen